MKLSGKVAIVTGSARGIGKAIAMRFASEGSIAVVSDILIEKACHTVDEIRNGGGRAIAVKTDVANRADVKNLVNYTLENFGAVHILVNNAGIIRRAPLLEMTEEDWDAVIDVDLKGVFNCTQAVLPCMIKQHYGKIINTSSGALFGYPQVSGFPPLGHANCIAAKAGVAHLTRATAAEASPYGINVNSIAPGLILTDIIYMRRSKEEAEKMIEETRKRILLGRAGTPNDIANLALFLASEDSSFITGQVITCDGGLRM